MFIDFTWKRCVFRTLVVVLIFFVAETIPKFGAILSLVGGSTVTILAYICPSLIYLKLKAVRHEDMIQIVNGHSGDVVPEARYRRHAGPSFMAQSMQFLKMNLNARIYAYIQYK